MGRMKFKCRVQKGEFIKKRLLRPFFGEEGPPDDPQTHPSQTKDSPSAVEVDEGLDSFPPC